MRFIISMSVFSNKKWTKKSSAHGNSQPYTIQETDAINYSNLLKIPKPPYLGYI